MRSFTIILMFFAIPVFGQGLRYGSQSVEGPITINAGSANPSFTINGTTASVLRYNIAGVRKWSSYTDGTNSFTWDYNGTSMMNLSSTAGLTIGNATATGNPSLNLSSQSAPVLRFTRNGSRLWDIYSDGAFGLNFLYTGTLMRLFINASGDVAIGSSSAVGKLHIEDADTIVYDFGVDVTHANAAQADTATVQYRKDANNNPGLSIYNAAGGLLTWMGQQATTFSSSTNQMWVSAGADTLFIRLGGNAFFLKLTDASDTH